MESKLSIQHCKNLGILKTGEKRGVFKLLAFSVLVIPLNEKHELGESVVHKYAINVYFLIILIDSIDGIENSLQQLQI